MRIFTVQFSYPTELEDLNYEETIEAWQGAYWDLVAQIGEERAKEHYPDWQDWIDEETGDVGIPMEDWNIKLLRGFQAQFISEPIVVLQSVEDLGVDEVVLRLRVAAANRAEASAVEAPRHRHTRLPVQNNRSLRVASLSPARQWAMAKALAYDRANTRWIEEMQAKYQVPYIDEEQYDDANLLTAIDDRRYSEIVREELALASRFDPDSSSYEPGAVLPIPSWGAPDEAPGMLVSDLLEIDDEAIAADLDRIESELNGIREELGDTGAP